MDKLQAMDTKLRDLDERLKSSDEANALLRKQVAALGRPGEGESGGEGEGNAPTRAPGPRRWLRWPNWRRGSAPQAQAEAQAEAQAKPGQEGTTEKS